MARQPGSENAAAACDRISAAWQRLESILERRPGSGLVEDTPAVVHWTGGTRFSIDAVLGRQSPELHTDMSEALGGGALGVPPGWLMRAALASCVGTLIVLGAAARGLDLQSLELEASSRSDLRGMLGLTDQTSGRIVSPAPQDCRLRVSINAPGASAESLQQLVAESHRLSPVSRALQGAIDVSVRIL